MAPTALSNIHISEITLCKAGKNGLQFIAKAADGQSRIEVKIAKTDAVKKIAVGVVYEPEKLDAEGEKATAAEIEKAAWLALKNHAVVNKVEHGSPPVGAYIAESYIAKSADPDGYPPGAWVVVVKVEDDALWAQIEKGEFEAFSMGGLALKTPVDEQDPQPTQKSAYVDASVFTTGLNDSLKLLNALAQTMGDTVQKIVALKPATPAADSPLAKSVSELEGKLAALNATVTKIAETTTDGRVSSPAPGAAEIDPSKY